MLRSAILMVAPVGGSTRHRFGKAAGALGGLLALLGATSGPAQELRSKTPLQELESKGIYQAIPRQELFLGDRSASLDEPNFAAACTPSETSPERALFDWSMPPRYGLDRNGNGIIDLPNSRAYVMNTESTDESKDWSCPCQKPEGLWVSALMLESYEQCVERSSSFRVNFDASASGVKLRLPDPGYSVADKVRKLRERPPLETMEEGAIPALPERPPLRVPAVRPAGENAGWHYEWRFKGGRLANPTLRSSHKPTLSQCLPEGTSEVTLRVRSPEGGCHELVKNVDVEDFFIVSLGDSYGSGEGNPEARVEPYVVTPSLSGEAGHKRKKIALGQGWVVPVWADDGRLSPPNGTYVTGTLESWRDRLPMPTPFGSNIIDYRTKFHFMVPDTQLEMTQQTHYRSHRSSFAASSQAALMIEGDVSIAGTTLLSQKDIMDDDKNKYSVTYVNLAMSGATIREGLRGVYKGHDDSPPWDQLYRLPAMESQLSSLIKLAQGRKIDALVLSVGGNDIGFANILEALVVREGPPGDKRAGNSWGSIKEAFLDGRWDRLENKSVFTWTREWSKLLGLRQLAGEFRELRQDLYGRLVRSDIKLGTVYLMGYPDITRRKVGSSYKHCEMLHVDVGILGQHLPWLSRQDDMEIRDFEAGWARRDVLVPLNNELREISNEWSDWEFVPVDAVSRGHGMCAERQKDYSVLSSYKPKHPVAAGRAGRWFRAPEEALSIQGGAHRLDTKGTAHPNEFGHRAMADRLIEVMRPHLPKPEQQTAEVGG